MRPRDLFEFVLLAAIWGGSFIFMRIGGPELGIFPSMALRTGLASLALLPVIAMQGLVPELRQHWLKVLAIGVLNSGVPFALFAFATLFLSAGFTAILNSTVPFWGALVAWIWLGDKPRSSQMLGLVIGFAGVIMLVWDKLHVGTTDALVPILACLLATFFYALSANATKKYFKNVNPLVSATGSQLGATLFLLPLALFSLPATSPSLLAMGSVLALALLCTAFAYILYFRLMGNIGPVRATTVTFLIPVFGMLWGHVFLSETVTFHMVLATLIILVGTSLTVGVVSFGRKSA